MKEVFIDVLQGEIEVEGTSIDIPVVATAVLANAMKVRGMVRYVS